MRTRSSKKSGFTLLEIMISCAIIVIALTGLMSLFARLNQINETANNTTLATISVQGQMEAIINTPFDQIVATFNNTNFEPSGFADRPGDAEGWISITPTGTNLLQAYVSVSWRDSMNRIIGEDTNLNGVLDGGEDTDGDGFLSSPARLITSIYRK